MEIVAVDDEVLMLEKMKRVIEEAEPESKLYVFERSKEVLEFAKNHRVDVFFLDVSMPVMDGVTLAKKIKLIQPRANIIFSTGFSEYMPDAFLLNASGYLLKPITVKQVREQLDILRFPVETHVTESLRLQCFGNFEAFLGEHPIHFRHSKTKEVLAYLTFRRGAMCTNNEIMAAIWEDESHESYFRDLRKDLLSTLEKNGCLDVIETSWGKMGLNLNKVECDYYQWLSGVASGINAYHGEFMGQYSWAEFVNASLQERI